MSFKPKATLEEGDRVCIRNAPPFTTHDSDKLVKQLGTVRLIKKLPYDDSNDEHIRFYVKLDTPFQEGRTVAREYFFYRKDLVKVL